ncbi:MAG: hypothetical protein ACOYMN_05755, partial [Roseimicrobium sp.]
ARGLVEDHGIVIFVTDRNTEVPPDVAVLSIGRPIENVGFAGVEVQLTDEKQGGAVGMKWRALLKNYGTEPVRRQWRVEMPGTTSTASQSSNIELGAGQTMALSGEFPPDVERATLVLDADLFIHDDRLPLQKPLPRVVVVDVQVPGSTGEMLRKMIGTTNHVTAREGSAQADVSVSELGTPAGGNAILVAPIPGEAALLDAAWTVAENHRLTRDLNWMGLLTPRPLELTLMEEDEPLLWKGDRVLALLRHERGNDGALRHQLLLGWDLSQSNAARHPAMPVLLHRFLERVREGKRAAWADNYETGQAVEASVMLDLVLRAEGAKDTAFTGRSPERVGFFEVQEKGKSVLRGAAHFADTREADFRDAEPLDTVTSRRWQAALKQTEADPWMPLWVLLVLGCLVMAWVWRSPSATRAEANIL